jgi:hypothetical protein
MTFVQIYALIINPLLIFALVGAFGAFLMKQNRRNAVLIAAADALRKEAEAAELRRHETRAETPSREALVAK